MTASRVYAALWIAWAAAFFAIELTALFTGRAQFTLSDFLWRAEEVSQAWTFLRFFIAAACVWLFFHLVLGWFR